MMVDLQGWIRFRVDVEDDDVPGEDLIDQFREKFTFQPSSQTHSLTLSGRRTRVEKTT